MKEKFYVDTDEANISRAEVFRLGKRGIFGQKRVMEGRVRLLEIRATSERGVPLLSDCEAFIFKFNFV